MHANVEESDLCDGLKVLYLHNLILLTLVDLSCEAAAWESIVDDELVGLETWLLEQFGSWICRNNWNTKQLCLVKCNADIYHLYLLKWQWCKWLRGSEQTIFKAPDLQHGDLNWKSLWKKSAWKMNKFLKSSCLDAIRSSMFLWKKYEISPDFILATERFWIRPACEACFRTRSDENLNKNKIAQLILVLTSIFCDRRWRRSIRAIFPILLSILIGRAARWHQFRGRVRGAGWNNKKKTDSLKEIDSEGGSVYLRGRGQAWYLVSLCGGRGPLGWTSFGCAATEQKQNRTGEH